MSHDVQQRLDAVASEMRQLRKNVLETISILKQKYPEEIKEIEEKFNDICLSAQVNFFN